GQKTSLYPARLRIETFFDLLLQRMKEMYQVPPQALLLSLPSYYKIPFWRAHQISPVVSKWFTIVTPF
ncbi:MAG TPA: hypothetical protein VFN23_09210, partial [Ktedonobacteraceae bacterium]|nr:hypothetical protein [Ktedonobacteraceae bacterium]